jgi:hypothetical protein
MLPALETCRPVLGSELRPIGKLTLAHGTIGLPPGRVGLKNDQKGRRKIAPRTVSGQAALGVHLRVGARDVERKEPVRLRGAIGSPPIGT